MYNNEYKSDILAFGFYILIFDRYMHPLGEHADKYKITAPSAEKVSPDADTTGDSEQYLLEHARHFEQELLNGFHAVHEYPKSVTFFGSARFTEENEHYQKARSLAARICTEGYAVITGGGGGIMEAGNRGSKEACDYAVGFNIELPKEQTINKYVTHGVNFSFFAPRKLSLFFSAEAYLFFPGGFGTLDELFELLTLIQTHKAPRTPVILVGKKYWEAVDALIRKTLLEENGTISPSDPELYRILDDEYEILEIVKNAPLRTEYPCDDCELMD